MEILDIKSLDTEVSLVEEWIIRAAFSVLTLYDNTRCRMHRDTLNLHQVGAVPSPEHVVTSKEPGRLATALALAALIDYLRVLEEGLESTARPALDGIEQILALEQRDSRPDVVPSKSRVLDVVHELGETVLKWSQQQNQLTDYPSPHYLQATVVLGLLRYAAQLRGESLPAASASPADAANTVQQLLKKGVGPRFEARHGTHKEESISHFVTFHVARAHDAVDRWWSTFVKAPECPVDLWTSLAEGTRSHLLGQLAYHDARMGARFRVADLAFSAALLDRLEAANARQLVRRAVEVLDSEQSVDGSWAIPPTISRSEEVLQISSYDVGFGLSCLLLNQMARGEWELASLLLPSLARCFRLIQTSKETVGATDGKGTTLSFTGWSSDSTRTEQVVTGWGTTRVLLFLCRYREGLLAFRQRLVLAKYEVSYPRSNLTEEPWADLGPMFAPLPQMPELSRRRLQRVSDPTRAQRLSGHLETKLVGPVFSSPIGRPRNCSFLINGRPGTRKTTLVKSVAEALNWPLLTLSPADFVRELGITGLQLVASEVFRDLLRLRRIVVLFDECEELFRKREITRPDMSPPEGGGASPAGRTEGAFLTAGMLPRLQALRDRGWVIFSLATNAMHVEEVLDEAVIREGRFDFQIAMGYPCIEAQRAYVERRLKERVSDSARRSDVSKIALEALEEAEGVSDISWSVLDSLVARVAREVGQDVVNETLQAEIRLLLARLRSTKGKPRDISDETVAVD